MCGLNSSATYGSITQIVAPHSPHRGGFLWTTHGSDQWQRGNEGSDRRAVYYVVITAKINLLRSTIHSINQFFSVSKLRIEQLIYRHFVLSNVAIITPHFPFCLSRHFLPVRDRQGPTGHDRILVTNGAFGTAKGGSTLSHGVHPPNKVTKVESPRMEMSDPYCNEGQKRFNSLTFLQSIYNDPSEAKSLRMRAAIEALSKACSYSAAELRDVCRCNGTCDEKISESHRTAQGHRTGALRRVGMSRPLASLAALTY